MSGLFERSEVIKNPIKKWGLNKNISPVLYCRLKGSFFMSLISKPTKTADKARSPEIPKKNMSCEIIANTKQTTDTQIKMPNTE